MSLRDYYSLGQQKKETATMLISWKPKNAILEAIGKEEYNFLKYCVKIRRNKNESKLYISVFLFSKLPVAAAVMGISARGHK